MVACDGLSTINESNESNNQYFTSIVVTAATVDLTITIASASPSTILAGNNTTVNYLKNNGNSTVTSSNSSIWLDNNNNGIFDGAPTDIWLADQTNAAIAAGATVSYNVDCNYSKYSFRLKKYYGCS